MADQSHLSKLSQGPDAWNRWRKSTKEEPDLIEADLKGLDLRGFNLKEANLKRAKLNKANLQSAKLNNAYMRGADLSGADLTNASLAGANLRRAVLRGAKLNKAYLRRIDLSYADLSRADLSGAVLEYARLVDVNLDNAVLRDCLVYGASVWNIKGTPQEQSNLVITACIAKKEPTITVDDLEVAQFIYLLLNHRKLRGAINSVTERGVLLLGRFGGGGLSVLQALAAQLREKYLPIIFDFERPDDRDYTETIQTLAGLSRFVIVDLSGPSVPAELQATVPHIKIPYVFIIEKGRKPFSLYSGLLQYPWVVKPILKFEDEDELIRLMPSEIIAPAEEKYQERKELLKQLFDANDV